MPKTLILYLRRSFIFTFFYINLIDFVTRLLIWCLVWMQVHWSEKSSCWKQFLEQWGVKQGSDYHVATSQRRDVPTSRRPHVATSPRRDVPTSRRPNVATLQHRDVSSRSAPYHLKCEWLRNRGGSRGVRTKARNSIAE